MRCWIAVALLASSWLLGLGYLEPARPLPWGCTLLAAVLLLSGTWFRLPTTGVRWAALGLLTPPLLFVPFPYNGMVVLWWLGLAASLAPRAGAWLTRLARGCLLAATMLLPQAFALLVYESWTARSHDLPALLAQSIAALLRVVGADATIDVAMLVVRSDQTTVQLAATWELLLSPVLVGFFCGGLVLLTFQLLSRRTHDRWKTYGLSALVLAAICLLWAFCQALLLVTVVLQQQFRATVITYPNVGETLVSTWVHIVLTMAPAILAALFVPAVKSATSRPATAARHGENSAAARRPIRLWQPWAAAVGCTLGAGLLTAVYCWVPAGVPKEGRVQVVERHSTWEPTTNPYDTQLYGEPGSYNYGAIYEYCSQFYQMSRLLPDDTLDLAAIQQCDVLVIKTPTSRYDVEEVQSIVRFVEQGGSLLLIGDHTNVFNMNTYLNDISRHFGFTFRNDLLFRIGDPYRQAYTPPKIAHPILQRVPPMHFAVSCSIDPGTSRGTMVVRNVGLYNLPPAYHESNYHPQAEYRPNMQYGAWCQLWSTTLGRGRVVAFADSTLFSNFCVFQPGKTELFMGMLQWLNHSSPLDDPLVRRRWTIPLACLGFAFLALGARLLWPVRGGWLLAVAAGAAGWSAAGWFITQMHYQAMPTPQLQRKMQHVVIDRTLSVVPLFTGAFADDAEGTGYGLLEQWIPRVGNYTSRRSGPDAFQGDAMVIICPTRLPSPAYRDMLIGWVEQGGRLLIVDTPDSENSTADSLLMLFGLSSSRSAPAPADKDEPLRLADGLASTPLLASREISGGTPLATWGPTTVAAQISYGQGTVTAVGFGSLFNDAAMGYHWLVEPDAELRQRYEVLFGLLRAALGSNSQ